MTHFHPGGASEGLSAWENEGGTLAPVPPPDVSGDRDRDEIWNHLGRSVVVHWNDLPLPFKRKLFRDLQEEAGAIDPGLRERMARYLHANRVKAAQIQVRPLRGAPLKSSDDAGGNFA